MLRKSVHKQRGKAQHSKKFCELSWKRYVHLPAHARLDQSNQIHFSTKYMFVFLNVNLMIRVWRTYYICSVYIVIIPKICYPEGQEMLDSPD